LGMAPLPPSTSCVTPQHQRFSVSNTSYILLYCVAECGMIGTDRDSFGNVRRRRATAPPSGLCRPAGGRVSLSCIQRRIPKVQYIYCVCMGILYICAFCATLSFCCRYFAPTIAQIPPVHRRICFIRWFLCVASTRSGARGRRHAVHTGDGLGRREGTLFVCRQPSLHDTAHLYVATVTERAGFVWQFFL
jgi:hypothetical protein